MESVNEPSQPFDPERDIAAFVQTTRRLTRLARSLAIVAAEMDELRDALRSLEMAVGPEMPAERAFQPAAGAGAPPTRPEERVPPPDPIVMDPAEPEPPTAGDTAETSGRLELPTVDPGTLTVTVAQASGPLDLVRVYEVLTAVPCVTSLGLTNYTRGRASILLSLDRNATRTSIPEALAAAFPDGVRGEWLSDSEYQAVLGPF